MTTALLTALPFLALLGLLLLGRFPGERRHAVARRRSLGRPRPPRLTRRRDCDARPIASVLAAARPRRGPPALAR